MSFLVTYDHSIFSIQERGGISRYFVELADHLHPSSDLRVNIVAPVHVSCLLKEKSHLPMTGIYIPKIRKTYRLLQVINNSLSGPLIKRSNPDIVHSTYYLSRYRVAKSCKRVVTVFDMIHEKFPDGMDSFEKTLPKKKKEVVEKADHVICISEQTRRDVIDILGIEKDKTSVIHLASSFAEKEPLQRPSVVDKPYFLYVGSRQWPKNFKEFVKAFGLLHSQYPDVVLACFGGGKFSAEEINFLNSLHLSEKQVLFFSGEDDLLQSLYCNALALVYPSLYEGFGLPLLEAMSCGCPVISSNTSSMPEVAGQAAMYFTPTVVGEMVEAMVQMVESSDMREDLISRGFKRAQQFSWEKCARETAKVYKSCL